MGFRLSDPELVDTPHKEDTPTEIISNFETRTENANLIPCVAVAVRGLPFYGSQASDALSVNQAK